MDQNAHDHYINRRGPMVNFYIHFCLLKFNYELILLPNKLLWRLIKPPYLSNVILIFWCNIKNKKKCSWKDTIWKVFPSQTAGEVRSSAVGGPLQSKGRARLWGGEIMEAHRVWECEKSQQPETEKQNGAWLRQSCNKDLRLETKKIPQAWNSECLPKSMPRHAKIPFLQNVKTVIKISLYFLLKMRHGNKQKQSRWWPQPVGIKLHRILLQQESSHFGWTFYFFKTSVQFFMLAYLIDQKSYEVDYLILILQRRDLNLREVTYLAQGHIAACGIRIWTHIYKAQLLSHVSSGSESEMAQHYKSNELLLHFHHGVLDNKMKFCVSFSLEIELSYTIYMII